MDELLNELNLNNEPIQVDENTYSIDLNDSNEYAKVYSLLDKSKIVKEDQYSSQLTSDNASVQFTSNNLTATLLADFNSDTYKLTIREN